MFDRCSDSDWLWLAGVLPSPSAAHFHDMNRNLFIDLAGPLNITDFITNYFITAVWLLDRVLVRFQKLQDFHLVQFVAPIVSGMFIQQQKAKIKIKVKISIEGFRKCKASKINY